jgi:hypothetical protein
VDDAFISVAAAAKILEKSPRQVRNYVECGALRARRFGPAGWIKVKREDVMKLIGRLETAERGKPLYGS